MNCCENKENSNQPEKHGKNHNPMKHILMMAMCCGLPLVLIIILPFLGIFGTGFKVTIASIIPFICPLMMIFMIPMMMRSSKEDKSCCSNKDQKDEKILLDKNK